MNIINKPPQLFYNKREDQEDVMDIVDDKYVDSIFNPSNENPYLNRYRLLKENNPCEALRVASLFETYIFEGQEIQLEPINAELDCIRSLFHEHERYIQSQENQVTAPLLHALLLSLSLRFKSQPSPDWNFVSEIEEIAKYLFRGASDHSSYHSYFDSYFDFYFELKTSLEEKVKKEKVFNPEKWLAIELAEKFVSLLQDSPIQIVKIKHLINKNERLLFKQTENEETAPLLQAALYALKNGIIDDNALKTKLTNIARGLYCEDKPEWSELLPENWMEIFDRIVPRRRFNQWEIPLSGLESAICVSKSWSVLAKERKYQWIQDESLPLRLVSKDIEIVIKHILERKDNYIYAKKLPELNFNFLDLKIDHLQQLQKAWPELDLRLFEVEDTFFDDEDAPFIKKLEISDATIQETIEMVTTAPRIRSLVINSGLEFSANELKEILSKVPLLTSLYISSSDMTPLDLGQALVKNTNLEVLEINGFEKDSDVEGLKEVFKAVPNVKDFTYTGLPFRAEEVERILENASSLKHLKLSFLDDLYCYEFANGLKNFSNLTSLILQNCAAEDKIFENFAPSPTLESLSLQYMSLDGSELIKFLPGLKNLTNLNIDGNPYIGENIFIEILECIPQIKILSVKDCYGIKKILPSALDLVPDLTELCLGKVVLNEKLVLTVQSTPKLYFLSIAYLENDEEYILEALQSVKELQYLYLDTDVDISKLKQTISLKFPMIKEIV